MKYHGVQKLCVFVLMYLLFLPSAYSQSTTIRNVDPGAVSKYDQMLMQREFLKNKQPEKDRSDVKTKNITSQDQKQAEEIPGFQLKKVVYSGNKLFKTEKLEEFSNHLLGKEVTLDDIKEVASQITRLYHSKGYITSLAYIPPQDVQFGVVEITLFEGKIGEITIEGAEWSKPYFLKHQFLSSNGVKKGKILNINRVQLGMGELNNQKYIRGQITLAKGDDPETTDMTLKVKDRLPMGFTFTRDNLGRNLIGTERYATYLHNYNLTGYGDSLYAGTIFASRHFGVNAGYGLPLGNRGTKFNFAYSYSKLRLGGDLGRFDIQGRSHTFSTFLTQDWYKSERLHLSSDLTWDMIHADTTILDQASLQKYEDRALRFGFNVIKDDSYGRWISRTELSTGLPIFGATSTSRYGVASSKFFKVAGHLIRVQRLPKNLLGIFRVSGQYSPDTLLPTEQLQVGGMYSVRGYEEGLLLGDVGYTASAEIQTPIPFIPIGITIHKNENESTYINLKESLKLAFFYDQGLSHIQHQGRSVHSNDFLQAVGVGLRCNMKNFFNTRLDVAFPIGRKRYADQKFAKVHFGITLNPL